MDAYDENRIAAEHALAVTTSARAAQMAKGNGDAVAVLNVVQFALIFNLDLSCLVRDAHARRGTWHDKLHTRHLVLVIFECVDDCRALLGGDLRHLLERRGADQTVFVELNGLHQDLHRFHQEHANEFGSARDALIAHRQHDAELLIHLIDRLDVERISQIVTQLITWLTRLHRFAVRALDVAVRGPAA